MLSGKHDRSQHFLNGIGRYIIHIRTPAFGAFVPSALGAFKLFKYIYYTVVGAPNGHDTEFEKRGGWSFYQSLTTRDDVFRVKEFVKMYIKQ